MKIHFERAGGFAAPAMRRAVTVDTAALPPDEARELLDLVRSAGLHDLPSRSAAAPGPVRDQFHYRVTVEDAGKTHSVVMSDADMPGGVRPLIDWLGRRAGSP